MADQPTLADAQTLLTSVAGVYQGLGTDVFPAPNGPVTTTQYKETYTLSPWFNTVNRGGPAGGQNLLCARYDTQLVNADNGSPMHQESGFWMLGDHSLFQKAIAIPRGITILAGGTWTIATDGSIVIQAKAQAGWATYGILNEPFLNDAAPTTSFTTNMNINTTTFTYSEDSVLSLGGHDINHTDKATLTKQP